MSLKKTVSIVFVVVLLFVAVSAVNAQESTNDILRKFKMSENCQDAIKRFPANLQNGFQGAYLSLTTLMGQSDEQVLQLLNSFLMTNHIKTNIILQGKGNEKFADTDETFSQRYT
jgi:predicted PurR-regulated permease PerM